MKRGAWLLLAFALLALKTDGAQPTGVWHMIDVSADGLQGDAHLLAVGGVVVMIDGGYDAQARKYLVPYLRAHGIRRVDHFFVSHPHQDHYEGLRAIIEDGVEVANLYYRVPPKGVSDAFYDARDFAEEMAFAESSGAAVHHPATGFVLDLPNNSSLELVHAQEGNPPGKTIDVNDLSLVMRWRIGPWSILFTGDLNTTVGGWLAENRNVSADVLKIPHHGARSLAPPAFFDAVDPDYAAVPGPEWAWCGERGEDARRWVEQREIPVWINGIDGSIRFEFSGAAMRVTAAHPTNRCKALHYPGGMFRKNLLVSPWLPLLLE